MAVERFLSAIKGTTDLEPLELGAPAGRGLRALSSKLNRPSAMVANGAVDEVLERTRDQATFAIYAELSAILVHGEPADLQIKTIFRLLRHPLTAGEPTTKLLALLEQVPGVQTKFGGGLWKAVEWAESERKAGRLDGLDLDGPSRIR